MLILLRGTQVPHLQAKANILPHAHMRPKRIALKTHYGISRLRRQHRHIIVVEKNPPTAGLEEPRDQPQQRAFAAPAWAQQKEELARIDGKVNIIDGNRLAKVLGDFFQSHRRHTLNSNADNALAAMRARWHIGCI